MANLKDVKHQIKFAILDLEDASKSKNPKRQITLLEDVIDRIEKKMFPVLDEQLGEESIYDTEY